MGNSLTFVDYVKSVAIPAFFTAALLFLIYMICRLVVQNSKNKDDKPSLTESLMAYKLQSTRMQFTTEVLKFIDDYIHKVVVIKYREFSNNHQIEMTTKINYENLTTNIANDVKDNLLSTERFDRILGNTIFPKEYYYTYAIDMVANDVLKLLDKDINDTVIDNI